MSPEEREETEGQLPPFLLEHGHQFALATVSLLILYWFLPELRYANIFYNDGVSHSAIIRAIDETWRRGGNITDFWMDYINIGHALLRSYQFLFHFTIWVMHRTLLSWMSLELCFNTCVTLMAMALPWAVYKGCRLLGFRRTEAVIASIGVVLIHERDGYGLGLTNFTYSGYGTYNQLFAMLFFPLTIGYAHQLVRTGKGAVRTSLAFAATFMAHILTGYFACVWIAIDTLVAILDRHDRASLRQAALGLARFGALVLLWTGHWVIPMAQDGLLQHKSEFEAAWKWTGHGADKMLGDFASGLILDADRSVAVLTLLSGAALLFCAYAWIQWWLARRRKTSLDRQPNLIRRTLLVQCLVWLSLTFGPMTWGPVLGILPFSGALHWHRFFAGAELAFMMAVGTMIGAGLRRLDLENNQLHLGIVGVVLTAALVPCLTERQTYFHSTNLFWIKDTDEQWTSDRQGYHAALEYALAHRDARFYAGNPWNWGNDLKLSATIPFYALLVQNNLATIGAIHHHQNHSEVLAFRADIAKPSHAELMNARYVALPLSTKGPRPVIPQGYTKLLTTANAVLYDNGNREGFFAVGPALDMKPACADNDIVSRTVTYYLRTELPERHVYPPIRLAKSCGEDDSIETGIAELTKRPAAPIPGRIVSTRTEPGPNSEIYTATVELNAPATVLFKMNYHPGWKALVDGRPAETFMVIPALVGLKVSPGRHEIRMAYEVAPLKKALIWIFFAGVLGLAAHTARARLRRA